MTSDVQHCQLFIELLTFIGLLFGRMVKNLLFIFGHMVKNSALRIRPYGPVTSSFTRCVWMVQATISNFWLDIDFDVEILKRMSVGAFSNISEQALN